MRMPREALSETRGAQKLSSAKSRLRAFMDLFGHSDNVLVLLYPDPDSMASALAVKRLLWKHVQRVVIAYIGEIQRLENQAMMELLHIPMVKVSQVDIDYFHRKVLVDSQPNHYEAFSRISYDAIIDHHPLGGELKAPFVDIRPEYGATATILIEYLRAAGIKPSANLATALLYAIKTDTANFERDATEQDVKEFRYVFQFANMNILRKIELSELRLGDLRYFRLALERMVVTKKGLFAHLGEVDSPDICVQIADFFMRVHGMKWTFVSGVYRGKLIVIMRNDGYRKDAGGLAKRAFALYGSAGGHKGAARAEIPLEALREMGVELSERSIQNFVRSRLDL
jgi:nanoRNase/pAp phosphatase (c-di-AMP/oligoRNAs hydrolase)